MTQLAFIGIGNIGRAMTKNLVEKGNLSKPLILYNRTTSRAQAHSESLGTDKTSVASTIADAVGPSDIIFSCLGDDKAVKAVIDEALQSNVEGKLFVECSTIEPATANALAKAVEAKGAGWISMPIFGAPPAALAGQLVTVPAGKAELIEKIRPYTTGVVARASIEFPEEEPGKALLLKITGNSIIMMMVEAIAQAHTMAEKIGLPSEKLHNFFESMFPGPYVAYSNRMLQGDYYKKDVSNSFVRLNMIITP